MTASRDLVYKTLEFNNPERVPRHLWELPWAGIYYPKELKGIKESFPDDILNIEDESITSVEGFQIRQGDTYGNPYEIGTYVDLWGCKFTNRQRGVIGEAKEPIIKGEDWEDDQELKIPEDCLKINKDKVNEICRSTDKFTLAGDWARPFERLQFIRGTEQLYVDLMIRPKGMYKVMARVHDFYCELLTAWAETDVDALWFMDDWGSQKSLLINPNIWLEIFRPLYREYIDIAHKHGKKIFMHSDGYILDIIPHLIDMGLDALNSQIFCMGIEKLSQFKGKITFWGEIDRQYLLPKGTLQEIEEAVKSVKKSLWSKGGCIAQCEFGPGANPDNVYKVFETWDQV